MWPLSFFESSASLIPEVDSPTSWDGLILYAIMLLVYLGFLYWLNKKFGLLRKGIIIAGLIWLGIYILGVGIGSRRYMLINTLVIDSLLGLFIYIIIIISSKRFAKLDIALSKKLYISGIAIAIMLLIVFTGYAYICAYAYFLPASYPAEQRDQLRMIRRIIEIEPNGHNWDEAKLIPLSEAHLHWQGKELIPDSIRQQSEFQGYKYLMQLNQPKQKLYTLDVIPIQYQKGMPSYHAYCVNPDELAQDSTHPYIVYCITMADHEGKPATEQDRHFHDKSLWKMWVSK